MRLEMGSWAAVKTWSNEVFSFTTDAGVEKGLAGVISPHMATFFPYIIDTSLPNHADVQYGGGFEAFGDGETGFQPVAAAGAAPVFFENALWVQGGKHICDGATDKLTESMDKYAAHLSSLQAIRSFFAESGHREFFKHECLVRAGGRGQ